jgi:hypothetical protein
MPSRLIAVGIPADTASVDGRRLLWAIAGSIVAAAFTGTTTWFSLLILMPSMESLVATQIVVAVVYGTSFMLSVLSTPFRSISSSLPKNTSGSPSSPCSASSAPQ